MKQKETIRFSDLNWVCKTGIIGGILTVVIYVASFLIGFFGAL